jgi:hypothetical protein
MKGYPEHSTDGLGLNKPEINEQTHAALEEANESAIKNSYQIMEKFSVNVNWL